MFTGVHSPELEMDEVLEEASGVRGKRPKLLGGLKPEWVGRAEVLWKEKET